ncbi:hypothetical protein [Streptomyces spinosisporus]|uniref:Uncharacterized protein n=1 Tax=Streptomyces spinosisporus TaxID=2927582 RepID=A0ABS9XW26_9ACTN|nr:hypothetical protein [Streptomyces spinosisporus]MCI3246285.1 hypothetical protein [Streptomyces spinosisporus]
MNTAVTITAIIAVVVVINIITYAVRDTALAKHKARLYPRDDGDVTALGPEIFASKDGRTVCWKGVNYERQPERP